MTILAEVRAGFVRQGTSLRGWCRRNSVDPSYAHKVLAERTNGPAALALRKRITIAATQEAGEHAVKAA